MVNVAPAWLDLLMAAPSGGTDTGGAMAGGESAVVGSEAAVNATTPSSTPKAVDSTIYRRRMPKQPPVDAVPIGSAAGGSWKSEATTDVDPQTGKSTTTKSWVYQDPPTNVETKPTPKKPVPAHALTDYTDPQEGGWVEWFQRKVGL